jgi:hypothetical protein
MTDTYLTTGTIVEIHPEGGDGFILIGVIVDPPTDGVISPGYCWVDTGATSVVYRTERLRVLPPLPTDPTELNALVHAAGGMLARHHLLARLELQIGVDQALKLFNPIAAEIRNTEQIEEARGCLRQAIGDAAHAVRRAIAAHSELADDELYDVEFAENHKADLALGYLDVAERAIATYNAINPDGALTAPWTCSPAAAAAPEAGPNA